MAYYNQSGPRGINYSVNQLADENIAGPNEVRKPASDKLLYGEAEPDRKPDGIAAFIKKWQKDSVGQVSPVHGKSSAVTAAKLNDDVSRVLSDMARYKKGEKPEEDEKDWLDKDYYKHRDDQKVANLHMENTMHIEKLGALIWLSLIQNTKTAALGKEAKIDVKKLFKLLGLGSLGMLGAGAGAVGYAGSQTPEGQEAIKNIGQAGSDIFSGIGNKAKELIGEGESSVADMISRAKGEAKSLGTKALQGASQGADYLRDYMDDMTKTNGLNMYNDILSGIFGEE